MIHLGVFNFNHLFLIILSRVWMLHHSEDWYPFFFFSFSPGKYQAITSFISTLLFWKFPCLFSTACYLIFFSSLHLCACLTNLIKSVSKLLMLIYTYLHLYQCVCSQSANHAAQMFHSSRLGSFSGSDVWACFFLFLY